MQWDSEPRVRRKRERGAGSLRSRARAVAARLRRERLGPSAGDLFLAPGLAGIGVVVEDDVGWCGVCPYRERVQFAFWDTPMAEITSIRDRIKDLEARREALWGYL